MTIFTIDTMPCCKFVSIFDIGAHESNKYTLPPFVSTTRCTFLKENDKYIIIIIMDLRGSYNQTQK